MMAKRWQIFTVLTLMLMMSLFFRISMAVSAKDIAGDLNLTADQLGILSGILFFVMAGAQIPLGPLLDRYGGSKTISLLGVLTASGAAVFAGAAVFQTAILGRLFIGLGTACVLMGSLKIFTNWFALHEFPVVSGFIIAAGNLGNLLATAPLAHAITSFGWRQSFFAFSLLQILVTLAVYLIVRDAPAPEGAAPPPKAPPGREKSDTITAWRTLLRTPNFWLISLMAFFWYGNYMVLQSLWGGPYLMEAVGLSRVQAGNVLLCTSLGYITGSLLLGKFIRSMSGSLKKTLMTGQAILALAMTIMLGPAEWLSTPLLAAAFFLIGLGSGTGVIVYAMARRLMPHDLAATAMTGVNFFLHLGAATVQLVMGVLIASFPKGPLGYPPQAYHGAFLIPIIGLATAIILFTFATEREE